MGKEQITRPNNKAPWVHGGTTCNKSGKHECLDFPAWDMARQSDRPSAHKREKEKRLHQLRERLEVSEEVLALVETTDVVEVRQRHAV